jgi:hypothetical protein
MAHTAIDHVDESAVPGLQRRSDIERQDAIGTPQDPVGPAGQHGAGEAGAFEMAAGDLYDPAVAGRRLSDHQRGRDADIHLEEELRPDLVHGLQLLPFRTRKS